MSSTLSQHVEWLRCSVQASKTVQDILPFFEMISMTQIQNFLMDSISQLDVNATRKAYFNVLSIMDTLPNDIIQHIESFNSDPTLRTINKKWNEHHNTNYPRLRGKAINSDTLFIHRGIHDVGYVELNNIVQFIGVGNDVRLICKASYLLEQIVLLSPNTHAYFENIIFDFPDHTSYEGTICLDRGSKMWVRNCTMKCGFVGILVSRHACLHVQHSRFQDGSTPISVSPLAEAVTIVNSTFTNCGYDSLILNSASCSCIEISAQSGDTRNINQQLKLQCIGNVFENNLCLAIAVVQVQDDDDTNWVFLINTNSFILKYNRIHQCQIKSNVYTPQPEPPDYIDPNKVYCNIRKYT
eukprot:1069724_1